MADVVAEVVLWGASGHARVLAECLSWSNCRVVALFDNNPIAESPLEGVPVYHGESGFRRWRRENPGSEYKFLVAIGGDRGRDRCRLHDLLLESGLQPARAIHPTAFVAEDVRLGPGSQVLARAAVCVAAEIGRESIVNTAASVDHECRLGEGVHVAPGATLAGCVEVGDGAMIGAGAVVLPRVRIGSDAVVGAGAVVTRDVPEGAVAWGNPARVQRYRARS